MRKRYSKLTSTLLAAALLAGTTINAQPYTKALDYNAAQSDFTTLPANIVTPLSGDATIEVWVNWRGTNAGFPRIIDFGNDQNNWVALTAAIPFGSGGPRFGINSPGTGLQVVDAATPLAPNTWNHVAVVIDNAANEARMYINGALSGTTTGFTARLSSAGVTANNWIGRSQYPGDPYFDGIIDELRISSVQRYTGASFTVPAGPFTSDASTRALYHFDEGSGQTSADASGNLGAAVLGATTAVETEDPSWVPMSTLPVRLTDFRVAANTAGRFVDLNWSASLDGSGSFTLERSADGRHFTRIATLNLNATSGIERFTWRDVQPLAGRSYYRLVAVENGSAPVYSAVVPVSFAGTDALVVYPNPVRGRNVRLELASPATGTIQVSVRNASGMTVDKQQLSAADQRIFNLTLAASLPTGIYNVEVRNGARQYVRQLVIE